MKYTLLLIGAFLVACQAQPSEFAQHEKLLVEEFKGFGVIPTKIQHSETGDLEVYYEENYENIMGLNYIRAAAITLYDNIEDVKNRDKIVFRFPSNGSYYDQAFETKLLSQEHTKSLQFEDPLQYIGTTDYKTAHETIGTTAGKPTGGGYDMQYYREAGFSFNTKMQSITYHNRGDKGCNKYEKALPYDIKFYHNKDQIKLLLGEPENDSNVLWKYKGNEISIFWMEGKIVTVAQLDKVLAKELREKYPIKKKQN